VYQTLEVLRKIFPYLTCDREITGNDPRACLYYDIKLCTAPCIGAISKDGYRQMISDLMDFLSGHSEPIVQRVQADMQKASEEMRFEKAAALRDQLKAMQSIIERQKIVFGTDYADSDVIAMAREDGEACVQIFFIRGGKLIGREYFILEGTEDTTDNQVMEEFVKQFYTEAASIPEQVMLPQELEERKIIAQWLRSKRGGEKVELFVPNEGQPKDLVQMATENATETLTSLRAQWQADAHRQEQSLADLQNYLNLSAPPNRIECYDVSHTQGIATVGAMVVFEQGVPAKGLYRKFNIESTSIGAPDDFASMEEMLTRRFRRWKGSQEKETEVGAKKDASFSFLPDLIIIDGGKGQLGRVVKVMEEYGLMGVVPVVGLAKQEEEIFFPHKSEPLLLPRHSQGLYLVQRVRDEAHRYGITAHRKKRTKLGLASQLDSIPGIGPTRRKALLKHFGSIDNIKQASIEDIMAVKGMNETAAKQVKANLE
jgi:excinuclease ABC subunit C